MSNSDEQRPTCSPCDVKDFSSQYGSNRASSYAVRNIVCAQPNVYPTYGDSTNALVFRTYGPWWMIVPSYRDTVAKNFPREEPEFNSRDFVDIVFPKSTTKYSTLNIYETYNPGTLDAVYAGEEIGQHIRWHRVWKYPEPFEIVLKNEQRFTIEDGHQQMLDLFPDEPDSLLDEVSTLHINADRRTFHQIRTQHDYPAAARLPRILRIPLTNQIAYPTRHFRLEFDHTCVDYYIEIDTVTLTVEPSTQEKKPSELRSAFSHIHRLISRQTAIPTTEVDIPPTPSSTHLTDLPFDPLFLICSHLDLRSLMRLSATCRYLHKICRDPLQFHSLNLQPYWSYVNDESIENFFRAQCTKTRYLSLAWTKSISLPIFENLLRPCASHLIQLNLSSCQYLEAPHLQIIAQSCSNLHILNLDNCMALNTSDFFPLIKLAQVRALSVYRTAIDYKTLLPLIHRNSQHLEHLNLGSCPNLGDAVGIVRLIFARCSKLRSIDLWRIQIYQNAFLSIVEPFDTSTEEELRFQQFSTDERVNLSTIYSLTDMPVATHGVAHMTQLAELELGWTNVPTNFIRHFVQQAGQNLIKIFLTACRRTSNEDILTISKYCPKLRQFDILNCNEITVETIETLLQRCPDLELLDLSYCSNIKNEDVARWRSLYQCAFKRSYTPRDQQHVTQEFP